MSSRQATSSWAAARQLAGQTPASRNRYVDFLRAASILAVVFGHWIMAAPSVVDGELQAGYLLSLAPWTQVATWVLQVMPVFFVVGGYSNAASWDAARLSGTRYADWLRARLRRLVVPALPLLVFWSVLALVTGALGVEDRLIRLGSVNGLVALWFLAVYVLAVAMVPLTRAAWRRFGLRSFWTLAAAASLVDLLVFTGWFEDAGWGNYVFVWLAVFQLGYLWREGRLSGPRLALPWAVTGGAALAVMVTAGPYPLSMVDVPGAQATNSAPPTVALLALGLLQTGLLLSFEPTLQRWLRRPRLWTGTVFVNGMIMTVFVWHLTAMISILGLALLAGGAGLHVEPVGVTWWWLRPVWMTLYAGALAVLVGLFARFEQRTGRLTASAVPAWRPVLGTLAVCAGLAMLAYRGIWSAAWPGIELTPVALTFLGAALIGLLPNPRKRPVS